MPFIKIQVKQEKLNELQELIPSGKSGVEVMNNTKKIYQQVFDAGMDVMLGRAKNIPTDVTVAPEDINRVPDGAWGNLDFYE